jgi:hypothetical protein
MHEDIRKFSLEGEVAETNMVNTKDRLVHHIESLMRDYSYVPALDLEPQFTLDYVPESEAFKFNLTVYGIKVDKEKAWSTGGIMNGKEIPKYTPQPK